MTGEIVIDNTQQSNYTAVTVAQDRSILFTSLRENEAAPQYGGVQCSLREADTTQGTPAGVFCRRNTAGTDNTAGGSDGSIHIRWTVATFTSGVTVQRGIANTGFTNPSTIALTTAADPAKSFVLLGGIVVGGGGWGNNEFQRARLVDANTLDIRATVAGAEVSWQVVTMTGATVERGTTSLALTDTAGTVATTAPGDLVLITYNTDNASSIAAATLMLQAKRSSTGIDLARGLGGAALDVSWEVVRLPFFTKTFTTDFAASETMKTQAIANLPAASSVSIASNQAVLGQTAGRTDYAGTSLDLLGEAAAEMTISDGTVALQRGSGNSTGSITWTVVDFAHDTCATF